MKDRQPTFLYIRADGNNRIGMGHIMRCLAIAENYRRLGGAVCFLLAAKDAIPEIIAHAFAAIVLKSGGTEGVLGMGELPEVLSILQDQPERSLFLIDSYTVTGEYVTAVSQKAECICMDDSGQQIWPARMIVNYNIYADRLDYRKRYPAAGCTGTKFLLGSEYAPLRDEFIVVPLPVNEHAERFLFTTGGADACHMTRAFLNRYKKERLDAWDPESTHFGHISGSQFHLDIVCGRFCPDTEEIRQLAAGRDDITVLENVQQMSGLLRECDVVLSAAGSTLYELCAMGIPTVTFTVTDNQEQAMSAFQKLTGMKCAGSYYQAPAAVLEKTMTCLKDLVGNYPERRRMQSRMRSIVDARGAERIADALRNLESTK